MSHLLKLCFEQIPINLNIDLSKKGVHFIRPVIHADKVVQCTASGHNQQLSREGEGVHFIEDWEPHLQYVKASFNYYLQ